MFNAAVVGRFAPSPSGLLHFGSLVAALASYLQVRQQGGRWLLRIEDLDPPRERAGARDAIIQTLDEFGLRHDGLIWLQSSRAVHYADALEVLRCAGHVFACRCSRAQLHDDAGHHDVCVTSNHHQRRAAAWRLKTPPTHWEFVDQIQGRFSQSLAQDVGNFVVWRMDGLAAYQLAVVVDDAAQGITDVVRGADLLDSTPRQLYLQSLLGLPTPRYAHVPLVVAGDGKKLSKGDLAPALSMENRQRTLRLALNFLGQDVVDLHDDQSVETWLQRASGRFDLRKIPRVASLPMPS
jgi:glutamyl-Q tRNA(Asp) synthetase